MSGTAGAAILVFAGALAAQVPRPDAMRWMPATSETLIVARGPFDVDREHVPGGGDFLDRLRAHVVSRITDLLVGLPPRHRAIRGIEIAAAVARAPRSAEPGRPVGPAPSCQMVRFDVARNPFLLETLNRCLARAPLRKSGRPVLVFEKAAAVSLPTAPGPPLVRRYFVIQPEPGLILCANEEAFLDEILSRMDDEAPAVALPPELPHWKRIPAESPFWAIRHPPDRSALPRPSLVMWYDAVPSPAATALFLGAPEEPPRSGADRGWARHVQPGVLEVAARTPEEQEHSLILLALSSWLGDVALL